MLNNKIIFSFFLVITLTLTGCNIGETPEPAVGLVAVVDLDKVAQDIGRDKQINEQVQAFSKQQQAKLESVRGELRAALDEAKEKLGDKPKKEDEDFSLNTKK